MRISSSKSATRSPCSISAARWRRERRKKSASTRRWSVLTSAPEPLLSVEALQAGYGKIRVLHGIDLAVAPGEIVALLGPNGAGKTTLLRALSGLLPVNAGRVRFDGRDMTRATPREAARAGLVHVIEGHRVFTQISVTDNLLLAGYDLPRNERADRVEEALSVFPEIAEKRHERGGALSGRH